MHRYKTYSTHNAILHTFVCIYNFFFFNVIGENCDKLYDVVFPADVICASLSNDAFTEGNGTFELAIVDMLLPYGFIIGSPGRATVTIDCKLSLIKKHQKHMHYVHNYLHTLIIEYVIACS